MFAKGNIRRAETCPEGEREGRARVVKLCGEKRSIHVDDQNKKGAETAQKASRKNKGKDDPSSVRGIGRRFRRSRSGGREARQDAIRQRKGRSSQIKQISIKQEER